MVNNFFSRFFLASILVSLAGLGGCNSSADDLPEIAKAGGTVSLDGKPLENVLVTFSPESGPVATGRTDASGKFELGTKSLNDGAVVGQHKVAVTAVSVAPDSSDLGADAYAAPDKSQEVSVPQKYWDSATSGLTKTINAGEENDVSLELTSN